MLGRQREDKCPLSRWWTPMNCMLRILFMSTDFFNMFEDVGGIRVRWC